MSSASDDPRQPPLPTFLVIGAQRSAARWLAASLAQHPDVFVARDEIAFFNNASRYEQLGTFWYRNRFRGWSGEPIVGEATLAYTLPGSKPWRVAQRIEDTLPDVRLLAVLRNPVDRAHSAMVYYQGLKRLPEGVTLSDVVRRQPPEEDRLSLVGGGCYAQCLEPFRRRFGDQLRIFLDDEVFADPQAVVRMALEHIGASPDVAPALGSLASPAEHDVGARPDVTAEERSELFELFEDDLLTLEATTGRDLSAWMPDPRPEPRAASAVASLRQLDVRELFVDTAAWIQQLLAEVSPTDFERPTPCADWTVRDLLNRMVRFTRNSAAALRGDALVIDPTIEYIGDDPLGAYGAAVDTFLATVDDLDDLNVQVDSPWGGMPRHEWIRWSFVNVLTWGWDLAVATGQDATIPAKLLEAGDRIARRIMAGVPRQPEFFTEEISVAGWATGTERFVAFLGRDPAYGRVAASGSSSG